MVITPLLNPHEVSTRGGSPIFPGQTPPILRRSSVVLRRPVLCSKTTRGLIAQGDLPTGWHLAE